MRIRCVVAMAALWVGCALGGELKEGQSESLEMSLSRQDTFVVQGLKGWRVTVGRVLLLRFGEVEVVPREGSAFGLEMTFLCDTPDLAKYDTPEKMRKAVQFASRKYVADSVEKAVNLVELSHGGRYGCLATFTDASLAGDRPVPEGEHRYVTMGILRLTKDSALTFRLLSNTKDGEDFTKPMEYVKSFVVADKATTGPAR